MDGLRVVELSAGWTAAALLGQLLVSQGASCLKLRDASVAEGAPWSGLEERLGRDLAHLLDGGKEVVQADFDSGPGEDRLVGGLADCDVLLVDQTGFLRCGGMAAWRHFGERYPALVRCAITPFGLSGPLASIRGQDLIIQAASGVLFTSGYPDQGPVAAGVPVAEHAGALAGLAAVSSLLFARRQSSRGDAVDIPLFETLTGYLGTFLGIALIDGRAPGRIGNRHPLVTPWNVFRSSDGWVALCVADDSGWRTLATRIGRADLVGNPELDVGGSRMHHVDRVEAEVSAWTTTRTTSAIVEEMQAAGIPAEPIQTLAALLEDEQLRARELQSVTPTGQIRASALFQLRGIDA